MGEEIFNAVTHGVGRAWPWRPSCFSREVGVGWRGILLAAALVYGIAQLLEYLMSTLYHALAAERAKRVFKCSTIPASTCSSPVPTPLLPHHLGTCGRRLARRLRLGCLTCRHRL